MVVFLCALGLLGLAVLVRVGAVIKWRLCPGDSGNKDEGPGDAIRRSRTRLQRVVDEQETYGYALPPPATTRATWELVWAISDYLRQWQPSLRKKKRRNSGTEEGASQGGKGGGEGDTAAGNNPGNSGGGSAVHPIVGMGEIVDPSGSLLRHRGQGGGGEEGGREREDDDDEVLLTRRSDMGQSQS